MLRPDEITAFLLAERLPLTAFLASVTRDFHLAEDIFQEVSVKAVATSTQFECRQHLMHWARLVGKNRAIDFMRTRDGCYQGLSDEVLAKLSTEWPSKSEVSPMRGALAHCIKQVTENNRELLHLRYFERRSCDEIASILGRKLETVYQALSRLHKSLGDCIRARLHLENA